MRSFVLASLAVLAFVAGCDQGSAVTTRDMSGTVTASAGQKITTIRAVGVGKQNGQAVTAPVDASGKFTLTLPIGGHFLVSFTDGTKNVGVFRFKDGHGGYTSILPVTQAPGSATSKQPQDEGGGGDAEADDGIDVGEVSDADSDGQYEPSSDPLDQVDSDDDGRVDSADSDDDNDGTEDAADSDSDNDGVEDADEQADSDDDGVPDALEDGGSDSEAG